MNCWNCGVPSDPTIAFCTACGVAMDPSEEELEQSDSARAERSLTKKAVEWAQGKLILACFVLGAVIAVRFTLLRSQHHDYFPNYRLPYSLVEAKKIDPPQMLEIKPIPFPLPTYDPSAPGGGDPTRLHPDKNDKPAQPGK